MLLTIHNLPSSTRYVDVKTLLQEKCGLTEVIVDNLVNEGTNKKVTVGLASEDDGAFVVRKLNGLFINGQQLYIEDRRRSKSDQPNRQASFDPNSNTTMQPAMAPMAAWNQNMGTPYMQQMPVDQNLLAYTGYGGSPQMPHYMEPQPVSAEIPRYSGHSSEAYAPNKLSRNQEPGDWGRKSRDQVPDASRYMDRKRRHSPERPAAASKRASRIDNHNKTKNRREPSPPRQQRAEENRVFQEQFPRQNQRVQSSNQRREPNTDYQHGDPVWEQPRWDEPKPREREQQFANNNRNWELKPAKVWDNQPQHRRDEPRQRDNQPKPQWESPPKPQWESPQKPQWVNQPKPHWESPQKPQWDSQPKPQWESPQKPQWDNQQKRDWDGPRKPQWDSHPKSQWDDQPNPQCDDNIRSDWYDHLASNETARRNEQDRSRNKVYNEPITDRIWNREPERSFNSSGRQESHPEANRDRERSSNGRQGRDDWRDRPVTSRDRSGGHQQKPDYGKPKENPSIEFRRQTRLPERSERDAPKAVPRHEGPRHDKEEMYRQNANKNRFVQEKITYPPVQVNKQYPPVQGKKQYPPVSDPAVKKFVNVPLNTKRPQMVRHMINKDQSNRFQATSELAKKVYGIEASSKPFHLSAPDNFMFKKLKECIKSRIDVLFGEELSMTVIDVVNRYRSKYPIKDDKILNDQIREKATREFKLLPPKLPNEKALNNEASNAIQVKKEKEDPVPKNAMQVTKGKENLVQNNEEKGNKATENQEGATKDKDQTTAAVKKPAGPPEPPIHPSVRKMKPGKPLTDKQVIQQMKLMRKWEYGQDDLYSLDDVKAKALDDEMAELNQLFIEECSQPADQQEAVICKHITTEGLNDFNKTIRLYISKRFLNIQTGLAVRMFSSGKPPKKEAVKQYLQKKKIVASAIKKSVKGFMYMINLTQFKDFDKLCNIDNDVIDGIPVNFRALHLIGPPPKSNRNQGKAMRQKLIAGQIDSLNQDDQEDVDFGVAGDEADAGDDGEEYEEEGDAGEEYEEAGDTGNGDETGEAENEETGHVDTADTQEDFTKDDFKEISKDFGEEIPKDFGEEVPKDFGEEINIDNINEEDLEDF